MLYTAILSKLCDDPKDITETTEEKFFLRLIFVSFLHWFQTALEHIRQATMM